jgi:hypothetical protein
LRPRVCLWPCGVTRRDWKVSKRGSSPGLRRPNAKSPPGRLCFSITAGNVVQVNPSDCEHQYDAWYMLHETKQDLIKMLVEGEGQKLVDRRGTRYRVMACHSADDRIQNRTPSPPCSSIRSNGNPREFPAWSLQEDVDLVRIVHTGLHDKHVGTVLADRG